MLNAIIVGVASAIVFSTVALILAICATWCMIDIITAVGEIIAVVVFTTRDIVVGTWNLFLWFLGIPFRLLAWLLRPARPQPCL